MSAPYPQKTVLVVGAGVAGLTAALDLARLGVKVHLVERDAHLGGQTMRLDKLYPTDHCAFCPVWTEAAACRDHPGVTVHPGSLAGNLATDGRRVTAEIVTRPAAIDPDACLFCGLCLAACREKGTGEGVAPARAGLAPDPGAAPAMALDPAKCNNCGACAAACPAGAIDLDRRTAMQNLACDDVIYATGFAERDEPVPPEFGQGSHPDILTAMRFEAVSGESGPNKGELRRPSNGKAPRSLIFIQCAGSRDLRYLSYCSSVCCMHALKQAAWIRRRYPDIPCAVLFTDLRCVGKGYESYARLAGAHGVTLVRGRPGLVLPNPGDGGDDAIIVRYDDTARGKLVTAVTDMVILNGGLAACPLARPEGAAEPGTRSCGFCQEPADVSQSVVQGARAAAAAAVRLAGSGEARP
jgi:heterodisulfide reductase subunit A2